MMFFAKINKIYNNIHINMCQKFLILFLVAFIFPGIKLVSQDLDIAEREDSLRFYFESISREKNDSVKIRYNNEIIRIFEEVLVCPETFIYPFDSVKYLGKLSSPDNAFRMFNWNIPMNDRTNRYFCILQSSKKYNDSLIIFKFRDKSADINEPMVAMLNGNNWYGALYYKIIANKEKKVTTYTLLGINFNDEFSNKKIIETLTFGKAGIPEFNAAQIVVGKDRYRRLIFEYSEKAVMTMKYEEALKMIVFDHLYPMQSKYKGDYKYYVPDVTNDALYYKEGKWYFVEKIDPSNPAQNWSAKRREYIKSRKEAIVNEKRKNSVFNE